MRIEAATLELTGRSEQLRTERREEHLLAWVGARPAERVAPRAELTRPMPVEPPAARELEAPAEGEELAPEFLVDRLLLERLFDVKLQHFSFQTRRVEASVEGQAAASAAAPTPAAPAGWGLEYDLVQERVDAQSMQFSARGQVTTKEGRTISLDVAVAQSELHVERTELHLRQGDAKKIDPLAVSLDVRGATLEAARVDFDLDADGSKESIARLSSSAGWLALDRNANGRVDDGSELFGPTSGDGFAELAALDDDRDGFLDEDDAAFSALRVAGGGFDARLLTLREAGIGAIGVTSAATRFVYEGRGELQATGVLLTEAGGVGLVQHVDLFATKAAAPQAPQS